MANTLNQILFRRVPAETGIGGSFTGAAIEIDGRSLLDWVGQVEQAQGMVDVGGDYAWIEAERLAQRLNITEATPSSYSACLMTCPCGVEGCWNLWVDISLDRERGLVAWNRMYNTDDVNYSALSGLVFDATQYRTALAALAAQTCG